MTKRDFLRLPIWNRIPDSAEIIGTIFSRVVHTSENGRPRRIVVNGDLVVDQNIDLIFTSNRIEDGNKQDNRE